MQEGTPAEESRLVPRVLVHVATYDERDNLPRLIEAIRATVPAADVLVTDDRSPDGTGEVADAIARADARVRVVHRSGKLGLGTAILGAMRYAVAHGYDVLATLDADFSHPPESLPKLLAGMDRHDVMIGSRYMPGGATIGWPWSRKLASLGVNAFVRLLLRLPARDASGGYRCYRVALLRKLPLAGMLSHGYSFQEEVLFRCCLARARVGETPIVFENRRAGTSKVDLREAARSLGTLLWLATAALLGLPGYRRTRVTSR